jgi:hypothetical protein
LVVFVFGLILVGALLFGQIETRVPYRLAPGQYYVVLDHSALVGTVSPPSTFIPLSEPLVRVSYTAQLAED